MKETLILLLIFCIVSICEGQNPIDNEYLFSIEENILPMGNNLKYDYRGNHISIYENGKRVFKIKLSKEEIEELNSQIDNTKIFELESEYSRPVIDGINWFFKFKIENRTKEIFLDNYYLESLDELLAHISDLIPMNKARISFGEDIRNKPDTLISYLPDFYFHEIKLPNENYSAYNILSLKKGYFITAELSKIELIECRIYPTDKTSNFKKRPYWRAFKQDDGNWIREYYDDDNQFIKTEYIFNLVPTEIVKETIVKDEGNKPSVIITRFTKTEIIEKE